MKIYHQSYITDLQDFSNRLRKIDAIFPSGDNLLIGIFTITKNCGND